MKKLLSIILAILMIVTTVPFAFAADIVSSGNCGKEGDNVTWTLDSEGTLTISGEGEISYKPFSDYCDSIITVIIENGVTVISNSAFESCVNLRKVNLPSSLTSIGAFAFWNCTSLAEINLPSSLTSIGTSAFWNCTSLAEINLPSSLTSIGGYAFGYCESVKEITIPDGITTIEESMFTSCEGLEKIILPNSLKTIAENAFYITNLSDIYYIGTADEWNEVEIQGEYTIDPSNYQMHYCTRVVASDNICDKNGANNGIYCSDCNKYFPGHDWTKGDGVCANGCGYECPHEEFVEPYPIYDSSSGGFDDEGAENLFDAKNDTKWCSKFYREASVVFHYSDKVIINSYTLTPAEDTVNFPTRNWMSWDLYGSDTDTGEWTHIHTVTNIIIPTEKESAPFTVNADTAYKYYKIVIKDIRQGDTQQMAGINIETETPWLACLTCGYNCSIHTTEEDTNKANCIHGDICDICGIEYGVKNNNHDWSNKDGVCANGCGATCSHEWDEGVLTRPTKTEEGYYTYTCTVCNSTKAEPVERADYTAFNKALAQLKGYLDNEDMIDSAKDELETIINTYDTDDYIHSFIKGEEARLAVLTTDIENLISTVESDIESGRVIKADYTEIDEDIAEIEQKLADENVTDEAKAGLEEIKAQLEEKKADGNTSAADLAELEKALEDYETELDAGIEDGSAVKVDGLGELGACIAPIEQAIKEKYGENPYQEILNSMSDEDEAERRAILSEAMSLTGSLKDNEDKLAELKGRTEALLAKIENCLNGTHNGLKFEVTEEAKCGENAIESATCTLCGETITREVENSALTHSFTKYEETEAPKCGVEGKEVAYCDHGCGETDEKAIAALTHKDADGDYKCDNGCGHEFEKPAEPDTPDTPDEPTDDVCDHLCHKGGFMGFIWKIVKFFSKLFKLNPVCECGAAHY